MQFLKESIPSCSLFLILLLFFSSLFLFFLLLFFFGLLVFGKLSSVCFFDLLGFFLLFLFILLLLGIDGFLGDGLSSMLKSIVGTLEHTWMLLALRSFRFFTRWPLRETHDWFDVLFNIRHMLLRVTSWRFGSKNLTIVLLSLVFLLLQLQIDKLVHFLIIGLLVGLYLLLLVNCILLLFLFRSLFLRYFSFFIIYFIDFQLFQGLWSLFLALSHLLSNCHGIIVAGIYWFGRLGIRRLLLISARNMHLGSHHNIANVLIIKWDICDAIGSIKLDHFHVLWRSLLTTLFTLVQSQSLHGRNFGE